MDKNQVWNAVLTRMNEKISRMEFHTWFKKVRITEISGGAVLISCPTEMNKNWLENKYHSMILSSLRAVLPEIEKLYFDVNLSLADSAPSNPEFFEKQKSRKLPRKPEVRFSKGLESRIVNPKFTLSNFIVGDENRFAHAACTAVAESKPRETKKYNPLFVYGGVGLGKTHLLQATANEIQRRNPDAVVIYTTAERFTNEIIKSIREKNTERFRKKYRQADALIVDDVQFFEGKEQTQVELFNTFNDLRDMNHQIIFSADRPPSQLTQIMDRLRSRMEWGLSVDVQMPGYETRLVIVQNKAKELGIVLPQDVQEFIAANVRRSLREMENILNKISGEIEFSNGSPTVQTVGKIFRQLNPDDNILSSGDAKKGLVKTPDEIVTVISEYFQVPATDLLGNSRKKEIVFPRQMCWLLCKDILKMSYEAIGHDFGGKNHTTVMHGIKKISHSSRKDSAIARHIHALKKDLGVR
ncbi:chromosomal replication initiator protein DnaA [Candidatus Gracilibacteria bacterium]|nr:chromosomal replication initiator protein DnaA [Candidatus Gracilibacteria bacterium]MCF7819684.1 chromosomal replication initiator protein DnaA [Candidatus Gracilibacteria bacterium]